MAVAPPVVTVTVDGPAACRGVSAVIDVGRGLVERRGLAVERHLGRAGHEVGPGDRHRRADGRGAGIGRDGRRDGRRDQLHRGVSLLDEPAAAGRLGVDRQRVSVGRRRGRGRQEVERAGGGRSSGQRTGLRRRCRAGGDGHLQIGEDAIAVVGDDEHVDRRVRADHAAVCRALDADRRRGAVASQRGESPGETHALAAGIGDDQIVVSAGDSGGNDGAEDSDAHPGDLAESEAARAVSRTDRRGVEAARPTSVAPKPLTSTRALPTMGSN